ncbi:MAG TPA: Gfo/Idh/MocA family oxidoreductase [Planctomycetaceae bacterium]|nr:Gfo/Idh/MocA family oxidoreductase [Planctomycetaceae bacterium]
MKDVRWGIIGCGNVTELKSGPAFQLVSGSALTAVMRRDGSAAEDYARRHGVKKWYDDAEQLILDPEVDAVYIATPPGSHHHYGLRVCEAGKPAYIEKPMARNHAECRELVDAFAARRVPLFVAYYRRRLPRFLKAGQLIDSGELGALRSVRYRYEEPPAEFDRAQPPWRLIAEHSGGGLFFDLGSHVLDLLDYWLGPLAGVSGSCTNRGGRYDVEDAVSMSFESQSGVLGTASWNFAAERRTDCLEILGTKGQLTLAVFANEPLRLCIGGQSQSFEIPHPKHVQQPLIQTIVDELLGGPEAKTVCPSTGVSAARTAAVMDQVVRDYYGTRESGFWNQSGSWPRTHE